MSAPADRIRPVLQAISTAFPHKDTHDAIAALAELERERDELRARLAEYEQAPTFTYMYRFPHMGGFVWRHSSSDFNGARPVESIELIARPTRKDGE